MDCRPPGSSVYGIFQARILGWVAISPGVFLTQGSKLCLLHWQADSLLLSHQGSFLFWLAVVKTGLYEVLKIYAFLCLLIMFIF